MTEVADGASIGAAAQDKGKCPKCGRAKHDKKYSRCKKARQETLLRDAKDPKSPLSPKARAFIKKHNGTRVPKGYEVSHKKPLYTKAHKDRCKLDKSTNMETMKKSAHRKLHQTCEKTYHRWPPKNYKF